MKTIFTTLLLTLGLFMGLTAQKTKKVHQFKVERTITLPSAKIWAIVNDYGSVAYSHPKVMKSAYINGSLKAEEGAERVCYFNAKGSKFVKEKIENYDPENMTFTNIIYQTGKFPADPEYTRATYKVEDLGNGSTRISFDMQYRTKPGMMGGLAKGSFIKLIEDYFISIEHHARTGEAVTQDNFKEIKKNYTS